MGHINLVSGFTPTNIMSGGHYNGAWRPANGVSVANGAMNIGFVNFDGTNINIRQFGTDVLTAQTSLSGTTSEVTYIGKRWDNAATPYLNARIFRVIAKSGAFTTTEMQQLEGWSAHRFSMTANLPAAHPYKSNPPIVML
jgi:hypothetical protein